MGISGGVSSCCLCFMSGGETYKIPKEYDFFFSLYLLKMQEEKMSSRPKPQMSECSKEPSSLLTEKKISK